MTFDRAELSIFNVSFLLKTFFGGINENSRLQSLPNHKLPYNVYLANIRFVVQYIYTRTHAHTHIHKGKGKGKAFLLEAWSGPEGSRRLRFPDYKTTAQDVGKVVSLTHRPPLPQEMFLILISVRGWVDPRVIVRSKGLCQWKIPMTPSGIEPATLQVVAQHLNHCATAVPHIYIYMHDENNNIRLSLDNECRLQWKF